MNLLPKVNFSWRNSTNKQEGNREGLLFSGFLIAFLGATGVQMSIPESFDVKDKESSLQTICQEHPGVKAIIYDSALTALKEGEETHQMKAECQAQKEIEKALEIELSVPEEKVTVSALEQEQEKRYQERVEKLEKLLDKHPLEKMAPEIAKQEPEIAALIVGIARKESQWGLRSPKKNGDCFNYWGFKGSGDRGTGMGYACFATREEAVEKIANRLEKLVAKRGSSKPSALVTPWKCGNSCATHSKESVNKWVSDVNQYYIKVLAIK